MRRIEMDTLHRVGFACKYRNLDQTLPPKVLKTLEQSFSEKTTTIRWLSLQTKEVAERKLWDIIQHNSKALINLISYAGSLNPELRMLRIGSDQLPTYTHPNWRYFWQQSDVIQFLEKAYRKAGDLARKLNVRLSMHPGQFVVLASDNPDVVERSLEEFEYHATLIRWMGFGQRFQDFKCNVHIAGKQGSEGIKAVYNRLSPEARNTITIENDEMSWGIEASLELVKLLPLVLDIHHHWIRNEEYIQASDPRVQQIIESWRGVRPVLHYSVSPESILSNHPVDKLPDIKLLLSQNFNKSQLRAHSNMMWNNACNEWAKSFRSEFDIMVEAKYKNIASIDFAEKTN